MAAANQTVMEELSGHDDSGVEADYEDFHKASVCLDALTHYVLAGGTERHGEGGRQMIIPVTVRL